MTTETKRLTLEELKTSPLYALENGASCYFRLDDGSDLVGIDNYLVGWDGNDLVARHQADCPDGDDTKRCDKCRSFIFANPRSDHSELCHECDDAHSDESWDDIAREGWDTYIRRGGGSGPDSWDPLSRRCKVW